MLSHTAGERACFALCMETLFPVGLTQSPLERGSRKCTLETVMYSAFPLLSKGCSLTQTPALKGQVAIPFLVPYQSLFSRFIRADSRPGALRTDLGWDCRAERSCLLLPHRARPSSPSPPAGGSATFGELDPEMLLALPTRSSPVRGLEGRLGGRAGER